MRRIKQTATRRIGYFPVAWIILALCASSASDAGTAQDLARFFGETKGAVVLYDQQNKRYIRYNESRCRERFTPFSTFKIPNSIIGLETKVIADAETLIRWEPKRFPESVNWTQPPSVNWKHDHTLRSAMKDSVVWYYRELARRVGEERMRRMVTQLGYGNQDVSGVWDSSNLFNAFWLNGSLRISADEQIEFLRRFYAGDLPVADRTTKIVKEILILEKTADYTLSGKTGGGTLANNRALGWFVGYVETKGNVCFFALNLEGPNFASIRERRVDLTRQILAALGYLPRH
ncbi:MAG TPA: penicillin-binding transpeptidase domain-containing protein [Blastocatellia bacterium]|nr:penicillin-binding transpeptidase domain-containing protein [Blastocatellia bacterium]